MMIKVCPLYLNELLRTDKQEPMDNNFWFPTPENPGDIEEHTPIQSRILNELLELRRKEKLNPQDDEESKKTFLKQFNWTDTLLKTDEQSMVEKFWLNTMTYSPDTGWMSV